MAQNYPNYKNLATLAEQYYSAWKIISSTDEILYYPRYFLIGTAIELYLKAIILITNKETKKFFTHDLMKLYEMAGIDPSPHQSTLTELTEYLCWYARYLSHKEKKDEEKFKNEKAAMSPSELNDIIKILSRMYKTCPEK